MRNKVPKALTIEREKKVWEMRQRGATYERIAKEIGITFAGVSKILERLHKRYREENMDAIEKVKAEQIGELNNVADEAFQAWERTKQSSHEDCIDGDPRYLTVFLKAKEDIRKIVGADSPTRNEHTGKNGEPIKVENTIKENAREQLGKVLQTVFNKQPEQLVKDAEHDELSGKSDV